MTKRVSKCKCQASGISWQFISDGLATPASAIHPSYSTLGLARANLAYGGESAAAAILYHLGYTKHQPVIYTAATNSTLSDAHQQQLKDLSQWSKPNPLWSGLDSPCLFLDVLSGKNPGERVSRSNSAFSMKSVARRVRGQDDAVADAIEKLRKTGNPAQSRLARSLPAYTAMSVTRQNAVRHELFMLGYDAAARELERRRVIMSNNIDALDKYIDSL